MAKYSRISAQDAHKMMQDGQVQIVDIRDADSFRLSHIMYAEHLDNQGTQAFIDDADLDVPLIVCCYHGNMSQSAGAYLAEKGFEEVYSLDGGFADWQTHYPDDCEPD